MNNGLMTSSGVAFLLSVSTRAVDAMAESGAIPSVTLPTGDIRFRLGDIEAWTAALTIERSANPIERSHNVIDV